VDLHRPSEGRNQIMSPDANQHEPAETGLRPPRFSLRALLLCMAALGCLFAIMSAVGLVWSAVILLFLSLVAAHVLGNSFGTRLRDQASREIALKRAAQPREPPDVIRLNVDAPRQLTERARLNRVTLVTSAGGALVGAEFGGAGLAAIYPQAPLGAVVLGVVSSAVLGGFAGFLASSFLSVVRQALAEAHRGSTPTATRSLAGGPR
jgi:hypothetical protein